MVISVVRLGEIKVPGLPRQLTDRFLRWHPTADEVQQRIQVILNEMTHAIRASFRPFMAFMRLKMAFAGPRNAFRGPITSDLDEFRWS